MTTCNSSFLRYDNHKEQNRILIFASDKGLSTLSKATEWFCDGTFKSSLYKIANQIFSKHALFKHHCVYIWTQRKSKTAYKELFSYVKDLSLDDAPTQLPAPIPTQPLAVERLKMLEKLGAR